MSHSTSECTDVDVDLSLETPDRHISHFFCSICYPIAFCGVKLETKHGPEDATKCGTCLKLEGTCPNH